MEAPLLSTPPRPNEPARLSSLFGWAIRKRVLRGALRHLAERALSGIGFDIEVEGIKLRCYLGDNATERDIFVRGLHAPKVGLMRVMEGIKAGDVFVDVGANSGIFTSFAAKRVGPTGRVIAIEPLPEMVERLRFNVAANGFANVAIFATAVGEETGLATLYIHPNNRGQSGMIPLSPGSMPVQVSVSTLASIVRSAELDRIDVLKIDIEGFEDRALLPFMANMPHSLWPHRIFMEIVHRPLWRRDCIGFLRDAGYSQIWQQNNDIALERRQDKS
jgi:FkbM family methyltransferase